jgi:hypothetical protein
MRRAAVVGLALLTACSVAGPKPIPVAGQGKCSNAGLDAFIGRRADTALGAELLRLSGARALRWAPPRSAITMDFREDRLTVGYDDAMVVTSARCG